MANVFLSYDREDSGRARSVAEALEEAGHSVWWDRHIRGGSQFSKEIEEALARAEAVVVLWSIHSVDSAWVRDEAATGRDSGRLVPARIDRTQPPLGFRQYQTIDLSRWKGRKRSLRELVVAVESIGGPAEKDGTRREISQRAAISWSWLGSAVLIISAMALGYIAWTSLRSASSVPTVTVVAADGSAASGDLARDLMIKLAKLQSAKADMLRLVVSDRAAAKQAEMTFEVRATGGSNPSGASLALVSGKDHTILWSNDFDLHDGNRANLQQQLSFTAARLLGCALEGLPARGPRLSLELLRPYLNACTIIGETYAHDSSQAIPLLTRVTKAAPKFEPAWSKLLIAEADRLQVLTIQEASSLRSQLRLHIEEARKTNPNLSEAYLAEIELLPGTAFGERASLIDRAISNDPDNVYALSARVAFRQDVGLMTGAVDDAQRAAQLDPLSPAMRNGYIGALAYAGRMDAAQAELLEAEQLWPGATTLVDARYRLSLRYGDPADARRLQDAGVVTGGSHLRDLFLKARMNPTPANVDQAVAFAWSIYRRAPESVGELIQVLGEFDREEELLPILTSWNRPEEVPFTADVLFRPPLREMWHDPRFMRVARAFGLLKYWLESDTWPEFCADPDLPYDCKAEAAKLAV